ncbi:MAG: cadmium-translocating P-type ATPase [Streptococcaceae bacterium]|jgi:Cd2+/Zn2+-exporting ATPase|nr:cadmium-translocating P-type ATPase [Streptococcaceae bacterium]
MKIYINRQSFTIAAGIILFLIASFLQVPFVQQAAAPLYLLVILLAGYHVFLEGIHLTVTNSAKNKKFTPNIHILMSLAAIGAVIIGDFKEAALLIIIFAIAHLLEDYAEDKSKHEITKLLEMKSTNARLISTEGTEKIVSVNDLTIGDTIKVLNGDQIPIDGKIISGVTTIDEAAINGESMPKEKTIGNEVYAGTLNLSATFIMTVIKDNNDTIFAKIVELVKQSQNNLSKTATKLQRIEPIYVNIVLILLPIIVLSCYFILNLSFKASFYRGMVFLISASPCALAASAIPATLAALSSLAKSGVLFKGGTYLAQLAELKAIAFDKTGTLTKGKPQVTDYFVVENFSNQEKRWRDVLYSMEKNANHPLAHAIVEYFSTSADDLKIEVTNTIGVGLSATYNGDSYQIAKPSVLHKSAPAAITSRQEELAEGGKTVVYFAKNSQIIALIALMDVPNEAAYQSISYFKSQKIKTVMITGDAEKTGEAVGKSLELDQVMANVMPEDKADIIGKMQQTFGIVSMVGDGVNDTPALSRANIAVAMGAGVDIAIDISDVILMNNDLSQLTLAHKVAKKLNRIIWQNIFFSMFVVLLLVILNFLGKTDIAIGVIIHESSTLVVILNGLRLLKKVK